MNLLECFRVAYRGLAANKAANLHPIEALRYE